LGERRGLLLLEVLEQDAGGADREGLARQPVALQRGHPEVIQQRLLAIARLEAPRIVQGECAPQARERRVAGARLRGERLPLGGKGRAAIGEEQFRRRQALQLTERGGLRLGTDQRGSRVLACRYVDVRQTHSPVPQHAGGQVVVLPVGQERRLDNRPRRDDADDLPLHEATLGLAELFTDRDLVPASDEPGDVRLRGVVRYASHRHALTLGDVPRRQHDVQFAGGNVGVLVKGLVKVAQPKEHDRVPVLALDLQVLAADGRVVDGVGHWSPFRAQKARGCSV